VAVIARPSTTELEASTVDVLVVDDDPVFRESMLEWLQQEGWVTAAAADGVEALRLVRDRSPRVVLLDLEMPVMNGWQFLERRRHDRTLANVPVIVVTALESAVSGRPDIAGCLQKPIDLDALAKALGPVPSSERRPTSRPIIVVVDDDEDTRSSLSEMLEEEGYQVARASNGQEAEAYLLGQPPPDCIVLDLWMPVMDGWQFTNRLQRLGGPPVPIVVITAAEPYWGYPVPRSLVVRKPIYPNEFLALIKRVVPPAGGQPARAGGSEG
jgi:CheY-like chemotaxis protein